ncbi:MAG TPA: DUF6114 domain-containing protein [Stackebrandtia sp.]|jgi:hypothetical protein|uniref:DUF6114 domain-containing protein n=1 Tax=Stackebrandtia sp. TaxID=2023065 RepID=UPI002D41532F|nr:DUF6114 domain-containing protein [Stackebrandtia sp.]HZE38435.1 DUF6114 domain-containing protein [Stackebrandtia sp.]
MNDETPVADDWPTALGRLRRGRQRFRRWRRTRPAWGGALAILGAIEIFALSYAPLQVMMLRGLAGIGSVLISVLVVILSVFSWVRLDLRSLLGIVIVVLGLASFVVSNLGGFFIGLLLMVVGGAMIFAWEPRDPDTTAVSEPVDEASRPSEPATDAAGPTDTAESEPVDEASRLSEPATDAAAGPTDATADNEGGAEHGVQPSGGSSTQTADDTPPNANVTIRPARPPRRPAAPRTPRHRGLVVVLSLLLLSAFVAVPRASADPATTADWPWPWPWPSSSDGSSPSPSGPTDSPSTPDKPDKPSKPDIPADCDKKQLPTTMPKLGTKAAEHAATALAACLKHKGSTASHAADLPTVASHTWVLESIKMTQTGLAYNGVVDVPTAKGSKRALEFTMDKLQLAKVDQHSEIPGVSQQLHVINKPTEAVLTGDVRLYVQRMAGLLFGLIPVVFTPDFPPPLIVPYLIITDATVNMAYARADQIRLPELDEVAR